MELSTIMLLSMLDQNLLVKVGFGQLEMVFTGFIAATFIIGIAILILGIFVIFFPGLKTFLGKLVNI